MRYFIIKIWYNFERQMLEEEFKEKKKALQISIKEENQILVRIVLFWPF